MKRIKTTCLYALATLLLGWPACLLPQDTLRLPADSNFADNAQAIRLMRRAQTDDEASSVKEAILSEQLEAHTSEVFRKELERQLRHLRETDSVRKEAVRLHIDSLKQQAAGAPVILHNDTILYVYTKLGAFMPDERAEMNARKIGQTAKLFSLKTDSLVVMDTGSTHDVIYNETTLISISDLDALWMNEGRSQLAHEYADKIKASILKYKHETSLANTLKMVGLALLVVLAFCALIAGVNYLFIRIIDPKIADRNGKYFKSIRLKNLEIINANKFVHVVLLLSKALRYVLYAAALYLTLPLLFSIFPETKRLAQTLLAWVLTPIVNILTGIANYMPNLLRIIIIVLIIRYVIRFVRYLMKEIEAGRLTVPGFYPDWAKATFNLIRMLLLVFAVILIFPLLPNSESRIFQGVSVFLGLVVSLGSTSIVGNLVAGLVITYMRPFKIGDRIRAGDVFGDIIEKSPFVIRVMTIKKEIITVPNLTILSSNVINYSTSALDEGVILYTTVTIGYDVPQRQVYALLITAALKTTHLLPDPTPFVLSTELGDDAISYQINAYTHHPELQAGIYSELHRNVVDTFYGAGVEILSPRYHVVRDDPSARPEP